MEFRVSGKVIDLTKKQVETAMKNVKPEQTYQHVVEVGRKYFPVKQVLEVATKMDRLDFTSAQARSVLKGLGFHTFRRT